MIFKADEDAPSYLERDHSRNNKKHKRVVEEKRKHDKAKPYEREDRAELLNMLLGDWDANGE